MKKSSVVNLTNDTPIVKQKIFNAKISKEKFEDILALDGLINLRDCEFEGLPYINQFISLEIEGKNKFSYLRFVDKDKPLKFIRGTESISGVKSKNIEQQMALDLLLDTEVKLVILTGEAGTGKTLISLASAVYQLETVYQKIIISRPVMPMGRDIGFIPGSVQEKLMPWIGNFTDNLSQLLNKKGGRKFRNGEEILQSYINSGQVELIATTFIRGRTLNNALCIYDEVQNFSYQEIKSIITRAGKGTKIVLMGDLFQKDIEDSGLVEIIEKFQGYPLSGYVNLIRGERSDLATLAAKIL